MTHTFTGTSDMRSAGRSACGEVPGKALFQWAESMGRSGRTDDTQSEDQNRA